MSSQTAESVSSAVRELKTRAEILHKQIAAGDEAALQRFRKVRQFRDTNVSGIRRRDCLEAIACEWGFPGYAEAKAAFGGDPAATNFGALLCPPRCSTHLNHWFTDYTEAAAKRAELHGYLLGFKQQFVVVDRLFIDTLGLDPADPDWGAIGFDWIRPSDPAARVRLYEKLVAMQPRLAQ